jgi:xanthosine utilization system XapX-like protein
MLAAMRLPVPTPHTLSVSGGFIVGLFFGDHLFPELERTFGDPTTDILLGVLCAIVGSLIYEIVEHIRGLM